MKLFRFGAQGVERAGVLLNDGTHRDASGLVADYHGSSLQDALAKLRDADLSALPVVDARQRLGAPIAGIGKIICVGPNYRQHFENNGTPLPLDPVIFLKAASALAGPNDDLVLPRGSNKVDWEVELAVVMGRRTCHADPETAMDSVAGYCVINDLSERSFQFEGNAGQWDKGKNCDGFAPIGPYLAPVEAVPDPHQLDMWTIINGVQMQSSSTDSMIFRVPDIISHISSFMTLEPGDVIATGTPPGVGMMANPPMWLKAGDTIAVGISGLGKQEKRVVAERDARN